MSFDLLYNSGFAKHSTYWGNGVIIDGKHYMKGEDVDGSEMFTVGKKQVSSEEFSDKMWKAAATEVFYKNLKPINHPDFANALENVKNTANTALPSELIDILQRCEAAFDRGEVENVEFIYNYHEQKGRFCYDFGDEQCLCILDGRNFTTEMVYGYPPKCNGNTPDKIPASDINTNKISTFSDLLKMTSKVKPLSLPVSSNGSNLPILVH